MLLCLQLLCAVNVCVLIYKVARDLANPLYSNSAISKRNIHISLRQISSKLTTYHE